MLIRPVFFIKVISDNGIRLKGFISASATGYYGFLTSENIFNEDDSPSTDFLGTICRSWEEAADLFGNFGIRTVKIRTAVVLEKATALFQNLCRPAGLVF